MRRSSELALALVLLAPAARVDALAFVPRRAPSTPPPPSVAAASPASAPARGGKRRRPIDPPLLNHYIKNSKTADQLLRNYRNYREDFNAIHLSAFWVSAGRLKSGGGALSAKASDKELQLISHDTLVAMSPALRGGSTMGPMELTGTAHGLAKAGLHRRAALDQLWEGLAAASASSVASFSPRELSATAWAFGKRHASLDRALLQRLAAPSNNNNNNNANAAPPPPEQPPPQYARDDALFEALARRST